MELIDMICVGYLCDKCRHQRENIDGWKCACDAFPDGIPTDYIMTIKEENAKECNNGIGYEPDEEKVKLFKGIN